MHTIPGASIANKVIRDVVGDDFIGRFRDRIELRERFEQRAALAALLDISTINQANMRLYTGMNKNFVVSGTNAVSGVLNSGGGTLLTTTTTADDQMIVAPAGALNSIGQTGWTVNDWSPQYATRFAATFQLKSAALTSQRVHVGLKLTANLDTATDDDFITLAFDTAIGATNFYIQTAAANGTTQTFDTGIAASLTTPYTFEIRFATGGNYACFLNGRPLMKAFPRTLDSTGTAPAKMTTTALFLPVVGIQTLTTAAKALAIRQIRMSRALS